MSTIIIDPEPVDSRELRDAEGTPRPTPPTQYDSGPILILLLIIISTASFLYWCSLEDERNQARTSKEVREVYKKLGYP